MDEDGGGSSRTPESLKGFLDAVDEDNAKKKKDDVPAKKVEEAADANKVEWAFHE